jgi:hypothetical protein
MWAIAEAGSQEAHRHTSGGTTISLLYLRTDGSGEAKRFEQLAATGQ